MSDALHYRIKKRAYELWQVDGKPEGREITYWMAARHDVMSGSEIPPELINGHDDQSDLWMRARANDHCD